MNTDAPSDQKSKNRPSHYAYRVKEVDGKDTWEKLGPAWATKDNGYLLEDGDEKIVLRSREVVDGVEPGQGHTNTPAQDQNPQPEPEA